MIKELIFNSIKFYQAFISPFLGKNCRFYPSCSNYMLLSLNKYGLQKGLLKGAKRILKCHPLNKGGVDLP